MPPRSFASLWMTRWGKNGGKTEKEKNVKMVKKENGIEKQLKSEILKYFALL